MTFNFLNSRACSYLKVGIIVGQILVNFQLKKHRNIRFNTEIVFEISRFFFLCPHNPHKTYFTICDQSD